MHPTGRPHLRRSALGSLLLIAITGLNACQAGASADASHDQAEQGLLAALSDRVKGPLQDCAGLRAWWIEEGAGFSVERTNGQGGFQLQYRPAACAACMERQDAIALSDAGLRSRYRELAAAETYVLQAALKDQEAFLASSGDLAGRIREVVGNDTVACAFAHIEATPSLMPHLNILIGFDRPQDTRERTVLVDAPGGGLRFTFGRELFTRYATAVGDTLSIHG